MRALVLALLLATAGCGRLTHRGPDLAARRQADWELTLRQAREWVDSSRHGDADRLLATFAAQYAGTPQANETLYWRALYRLDPANRTHGPSEALEMLRAYLASPGDSTNAAIHAQAEVLRRTALEVERLRRAVSSANAAAAAETARANAAATAPRPADTSKDEEITRLREQLKEKTDELDRIKRRLRRP